MKGRILFIVCLLGIVTALMVMPVSAGNTGTVGVSGSIPQVVSIVVNSPTQNMAFSPGNTASVSNSLTVSSNGAFTITIADNSGRGTVGGLGYMGNYTTAYVAPGSVSPYINTTLASPLHVTGSTVGDTVAQTLTYPITGAQTLFVGSQPVSTAVLPLQITQAVSTTDPVLPGSNTYRDDLIFTITMH